MKRNGPNGWRARLAPTHRALYRWHRRIGIVAALFMIVLALTGMLLEHAASLGLARIKIEHRWITGLYDSALEARPLGTELEDNWLIWIDGRLYLGSEAIGRGPEDFVGAVATPSILAVAGSAELLLFTERGERIERLTLASLPGPISRIGRIELGEAAVATAGMVYTTSDFLHWRPRPEAARSDIAWSVAGMQIPGGALRPALQAHGRAPVPLQRLLLDLHTGRIMGPIGPYLMDGAAIALLLLSGTGLVLWSKRRRSIGRTTQRKD